MIPEIRKKYNELFTDENYQAYINELSSIYPGQLEFRIAETPVFVPKDFTQKMLDACDHILDVLNSPAYLEQSDKAIPPQCRVPGKDGHPQFIAFDFGVCIGKDGVLEPQLIELQGFPSLFAWEVTLPQVHHRHFWWPENYDVYLNGFTHETYLSLLKRIVIGDAPVEEVILLEILPHQQKTRVDFYATEQYLGIQTVDLADLIQEGRNLFYMNKGRKVKISRIYNRVIFDDLFQQSEAIREKGKIFQEDIDVVWVPHPNWFYRISKYSLPFIRHPYVPETHFLNEFPLPDDAENYVVKPLFSFAGQGVIIDVTPEQVEAIKDPWNWIIQKKVNYAPAVTTPEEPAKVEIRLFYFWEEGAPKAVATNHLSRLSKGKMIGVRYNKDKDWVGGSFCLFQQ